MTRSVLPTQLEFNEIDGFYQLVYTSKDNHLPFRYLYSTPHFFNTCTEIGRYLPRVSFSGS